MYEQEHCVFSAEVWIHATLRAMQVQSSLSAVWQTEPNTIHKERLGQTTQVFCFP